MKHFLRGDFVSGDGYLSVGLPFVSINKLFL